MTLKVMPVNNDREVHVAFLFASPIVLETSPSTYFDVLSPISFKEEFDEILEGLKGTKFKYKQAMADETNLRECLNLNPVGIHFSGHGFQNSEKVF